MSTPRPRSGILELGLYPVGDSSLPGFERVINLASNENAVAPSAAVLDAACKAAAEVNRYHDGSYTGLRSALAERHALDAEGIVCGNGSGELIALLVGAYTGPGDEVLMGEHGYLYFRTATRIAGATPVRVPAAGLRFDVDAALAAVTPRTRMLLLDNPNNPTGSVLCQAEVQRLREGLPEHVLLVLDAAYAEFVSTADYDAGSGLVLQGENTVMLRTFSKIHGLAGMRVGWGFMPRAVAGVLNRVRLPNNVGHVAQAAARVALAERERVSAMQVANAASREHFIAVLRGLGLAPQPSEGSFVLVRFPGGASQAAGADAWLRRAGIIVRPMGAYGLADCLRVTIGSASETKAVEVALAAFGAG